MGQSEWILFHPNASEGNWGVSINIERTKYGIRIITRMDTFSGLSLVKLDKTVFFFQFSLVVKFR